MEADSLADAFSQFIAASARLEGSYRDLQGEVAQLSRELADRNAALKVSLDENRRMRLALEGVVASMPCGVLVLGARGAIRMMNPEAARLLALGDAMPRTLEEIAAAAGVDLAAWSAIDGEQEFCIAGPEGKRWIEMRTRRVHRAATQEAAQTILILRDTTAHKQAEAEREAARRAMSLAEIAAILAHEIRNPLASLELFAGLIAEDAASAPEQNRTGEWVQHLRAGIRSLSGTVNNVLSLHGTGRSGLAAMPLSPALASAVEFVRPIAEQAQVALTFRSQCPSATVLGNAGALGQIVLNLVTNAVRHTSAGGRIAVSVLPAGESNVRVEVADSGCGIAPEHLPELFRAGFSASGSSSGLGLAVCRQIAAQHGGTIDVASVPGEGTTFCVELPTA